MLKLVRMCVCIHKCVRVHDKISTLHDTKVIRNQQNSLMLT